MELTAFLILAALFGLREWLHHKELQNLLDRVQAPEQVIAERAPEPTGEAQYVPFEDDEAYETLSKNGDL